MESQGFFPDLPDRSNALPFLKLIRVPKGGEISVTILSTDVTVALVHRIDGRPFRCPGPNCPIAGCPDNGRYQGYLEVLKHKPAERVMLELTADACHWIKCVAIEHGMQWRGLQLLLKRATNSAKSPIVVEHWGTVKDDLAIPQPRDMRPFVARLFKKK